MIKGQYQLYIGSQLNLQTQNDHKAVENLPFLRHYSQSQNHISSKTHSENDFPKSFNHSKRKIQSDQKFLPSLKVSLLDGIPNNSLHQNLKQLIGDKKITRTSIQTTVQKVNLFSLGDDFSEKAELSSPVLTTQQKLDKGMRIPSMRDLQSDQLWIECKSKIGQMQSRAYHTAVYEDGKMFIFGGRDGQSHIYNDLIIFSVQNTSNFTFKWRLIKFTDGVVPPKIYHHTAVIYKRIMYVFGGKITPFKNSELLYGLNLDNLEWQIYSNNSCISSIEGHTANIIDDKMIVFGGQKSDSDLLAILQIYDFENDEWNVQSYEGQVCPQPRVYHASTTIDNNLFVFGGLTNDGLTNDLWQWNNENGWNQIIQNKGPQPRMGHIMINDGVNQLFVFSGYEGVLKEKNDIWKFDLETCEWSCIDYGVNYENQRDMIQKKLRRQTYRKSTFVTKEDQFKLIKEDNLDQSRESKVSFSKFQKMKQNEKNNQRITEQQAQELQQRKKKRFLQNFEIQEFEKERYLLATPTTRKMQYSIQLSDKLEFLIQNRKLGKIQLNNNLDLNQNSKPLTRDGCSCVQTEGGWMIYGGDRNKISFNDTWFLSARNLNY